MVLGTASHVGKTLLAAALGRIFSDDGYRVAPFKAQNMALNSAATPDGYEIGRAQALQAEACRVAPRVEMNPILIKPSSEHGAQVVLLGRVWEPAQAAGYQQHHVDELFPFVLASYRELASQYDLLIIEGAGSCAEINLKAHDIVNLRMAETADAACLLVGDIDRGGVFASLLGTLELLEPAERSRIRGFVVNKFRGDVELLRPGLRMIEQRMSCPCLGVVPFLKDLGLEEEDSVVFEEPRGQGRAWQNENSRERPLRVGVIGLPHVSNFTDFDPLAQEPSIELAYLRHAEESRGADLLIIPGTKQTFDDLEWLNRSGFARILSEYSSNSHKFGIVGICGGMQMLGRGLEDPTGSENNGVPQESRGLGLLPITTVLKANKITQPITGRVSAPQLFGQPLGHGLFEGYEIHLGQTVYEEGAASFAELTRTASGTAVRDGAVSDDGFVFGTYAHGLFDDDRFRHAFIQAVRAACDLAPARKLAFITAERETRIDRLALHVRRFLDIDQIKSWID